MCDDLLERWFFFWGGTDASAEITGGNIEGMGKCIRDSNFSISFFFLDSRGGHAVTIVLIFRPF